MALVESQEVSLAISMQAAGEAGIAALAEKVEALGREGGEAAPKFVELAQELRRLGDQQVRIDGLQTAIESAKSAHAAVREARHEVQVLDKALGDAKGAGAGRDAIRLLEKELASANRQLSAAEKAWNAKKAALASARSETQAAGVDTANLGSEQQRLQQTLAAVVQRVKEEQAALASINPALKSLGTAADQTSAALNRLGIRSADQIQAEINAINQDLLRLASNAKLSGADFDRAWAAGQKRIAALKAEMNGAVDPFVQSMDRAGTRVDGLMTKLRPLAGALAAAFSVQQGVQSLIDANTQAERLTRSLQTLATPAISAREQLTWLREMADRNGVAFDRLSQSFVGFAAATRGTALEGEKSREIYDAIVTSMGRLGRTSDEVGRALQAVGQMASKGTVSMEELRGQLAESMPGALQAMAAGLGLTTEQLIKMVSEGRLLAEDALPALQRELQKTIDAVSDDRVAGMEAGWNRLRNAIDRALDAGQDKRNKTGEFLSSLAAGVDRLTDRGQTFENSWYALLRAIETGDWGTYSAAVDAHAEATRLSGDKAALAAEAHRMLGNAAVQAGTQAQQSAPAWTTLDNAYTQILTHVREQIALAEKNAIARQAEGAAAIALAQAFGTEAEQRTAAVNAAAGNAEALHAVAQQRLAEVATLQNQIAAMRENMVANNDESASHRQAIADLQTKLAARQADADRAVAQAASSRLSAEATKAEAAAMADNAHRVVELRAAYEQARAALESMRAARDAGKSSADAMAASELAAGRAAYAYRDALNDQSAAIQANLNAKQAQNQLDQNNIQLSIAVAQRAYELAKAKGDEKRATEELLHIKRLEADLAELQAKALRAQAAAELEAVRNKRELAQASGMLTRQLELELKAQQLAADAKVVQGKIAEEVAAKMRDLANEGARAGAEIEHGMNRAAVATDGVGAAADRTAEKFKNAALAAKSMAQEMESISAGGGMRGTYTSPLTQLYDEAERKGGKELRKRAEDLYKYNARMYGNLTATPERLGDIMRQIDLLIANYEAKGGTSGQQQSSVGGAGGTTRTTGATRGGSTPSTGLQVDRVVQINWAGPSGRPVTLYASPENADAFFSDLESAAMRAR